MKTSNSLYHGHRFPGVGIRLLPRFEPRPVSLRTAFLTVDGSSLYRSAMASTLMPEFDSLTHVARRWSLTSCTVTPLLRPLIISVFCSAVSIGRMARDTARGEETERVGGRSRTTSHGSEDERQTHCRRAAFRSRMDQSRVWAGERLTDGQIAGVVFVANQAEIAAGESALRRTQSRSVQALATRIVTEHAQVNQEIIALAQRPAANLQRSATSDALTKQNVR
jgi:hypothetical protein